jgi:amidase
MEGVKLSSVSLDTLGFFSRSIKDLKLLASVFQLPILRMSHEADFTIRGARFGVCFTTAEQSLADEDAVLAIRKMEGLLVSNGAIVENIELPGGFQNMDKWATMIRTQEGRAAFLNEHLTNHNHLVPNIADFWGQEADARSLLEAYDGFANLRIAFQKIFSQYCAIIAPSAKSEAPLGLDHTGEALFVAPWTSLHFPVINIPGFLGKNGMPVGVSLVASRFCDAQLLQIAEDVAALCSGDTN